jgi:predicted nicotinamide N-methyase
MSTSQRPERTAAHLSTDHLAADRALEAIVAETTEPMRPPALPELTLHLAREPLGIWQEVHERCLIEQARRPFWAFAWPGGQAMARHLLDNRAIVTGRSVLDLGTGSGIAAIAAAKAGARRVVANDIDVLAVAAARLNARLNAVDLDLSADDLLGGAPSGVDVVLLADVVYEPELKMRVAGFLDDARRRGITVLFGDRGTTELPFSPIAKLAEHAVPPFPELQVGQLERGIVWRLA